MIIRGFEQRERPRWGTDQLTSRRVSEQAPPHDQSEAVGGEPQREVFAGGVAYRRWRTRKKSHLSAYRPVASALPLSCALCFERVQVGISVCAVDKVPSGLWFLLVQ